MDGSNDHMITGNAKLLLDHRTQAIALITGSAIQADDQGGVALSIGHRHNDGENIGTIADGDSEGLRSVAGQANGPIGRNGCRTVAHQRQLLFFTHNGSSLYICVYVFF